MRKMVPLLVRPTLPKLIRKALLRSERIGVWGSGKEKELERCQWNLHCLAFLYCSADSFF